MNPAEFASLPSDACALDTEGSYGPDRISRTTYDAAGQVTKVETGYGVTGVAADEVRATYTGNGLVQTATDAEGNASYFHYEGHDRLQYWVMPSATATGYWDWSNIEYYGYDANGNRTLLVRRDGSSITFSYDNLNRVTAKDPPGSEPTVSYGYDLLGRMTSAATSAQTLTFAFDALGRNTSQAGPHGTVTYAYDLADRRTLMTYADSGLVVGYGYNVAGEVSEIRENPSGGNVLLGSYAYDDLGRRTSLTRGNGTVTSYAYDNASRLTQLVQNLNGTTNDLTLDFTLSPASEIVSNTRSNDAFSFTGHANGSVASTVNGLNQVTAHGGVSVSHDARGNVSAIGSASYGYDSENRLTSAPSSVAFGHDPLGRLYFSTGDPQLTRFAYDGGSLIAEYDYGMGLLRRYVNGPGVDEPLVWYEGTGTSTRRYFHADERGSVVAVSDGSGNLVGSTPNRYDEYGVPQGTLTGRFGYTGQMWLPEVGLYHYRARAYNPAMGRFMQTDPIGYGSGMNLFAYVGNNPVNRTDPLGLDGPDSDVLVTGDRCRDISMFDDDPRKCRTSQSWGPPPIFDPGFGVGGGQEGQPSDRPLQGECDLNGVHIAWNGNNLRVSGNIQFFWGPGGYANNYSRTTDLLPIGLATTYLDIINGTWTNPNLGAYSILTQMALGPGGVNVYVGGDSGIVLFPGGNVWVPTLTPPGSPDYQTRRNVVAGEFGHRLGLSVDTVPGRNQHLDGGIMGRLHQGAVLPSHVEKIIRQCIG